MHHEVSGFEAHNVADSQLLQVGSLLKADSSAECGCSLVHVESSPLA